MPADNRAHLAAAAAARSKAATQRVTEVLRGLDRSGAPASLAQVAAQSKVSRTFLYSKPDLLQAYRTLEAAQAGRQDPIPRRQRATEASLLTRNEALINKNATLRQENAALRRQVQAAYGQLRENRPQPERPVQDNKQTEGSRL